MTLEELGKKTKARYPEYANIDDRTLGERVAEKYPVYKRQIDEYQKQSVQVTQSIQQKQAQPEKKQGLLSKIGSALTSSEQKFGDTLGQSGAILSGADKTIDKANQTYMDTGNRMVQEARKQTDPVKRANYIRIANDNFSKAGSTYKAVLPAIEKNNKQILGEAAGVGLDVLTAGTVSLKGSGAVSKIPSAVKKIVKPATVKIASNTAKNTVIKGTLKAAGEGALIGGAYGAAGAAQENQDVMKGAASGALVGGVAGGIIGGVASKLTKKTTSRLGNRLSVNDNLGAQGQLAKNLNDIIDTSAATTRKISKFSKEQGTDIGQELAKRKMLPKVENERMVFDSKYLDDIEEEIAQKSRIIDEAASLYKTNIPANDLKNKAVQYIKNNQVFASEGRVGEVTEKAIKKIDDFVEQTGKESFTLSDLQTFKKGMWSASKKFKMTEMGSSDAYSELGSVFRKVIEEEIPDASIKQINKEIGKLENVSKFLNATSKSGGIVLKGGRIGKYFSDIAAVGVGGVAGTAALGPVGGIIAAGLGKSFAEKIRTVSQKNAVLGLIDRLLLKLSKKSPDSEDIIAAQKFIAEVKAGKNVTATTRVQKVISEILKKEYGIGAKTPLMLPEGKTNGVVNNVSIKLPEKSQSTLESLERKVLSEQKRTTDKVEETTKKMLSAYKSAEVNSIIKSIIEKDAQKKPLTRIEKAILELRGSKQ